MDLKIIVMLLSGVGVFVGSTTYAYMSGKTKAEMECQIKVITINKAIQDKEAEYQKQIAKLNNDVIIANNRKESEIEKHYEIRYKTKIVYLKEHPADNPVISLWWVQYLNASYRDPTVSINDATSTTDGIDASVKLDTIADTTVNNARLYYVCKYRLEALQDYIRKQIEIRGE